MTWFHPWMPAVPCALRPKPRHGGLFADGFIVKLKIYGGARYQKVDTVSLLLAYRYLDTEYESNQFKWDVSQSGFGIGLGFRW